MKMPKQKTRKTIRKRFKITAKGKTFKKRVNTSHLRRKNSNSAKFRKQRLSEVPKGSLKKLEKII